MANELYVHKIIEDKVYYTNGITGKTVYTKIVKDSPIIKHRGREYKFNREFNTISLIGVLEHLTNPNLLLNSFSKGKAKFLYISIPLFSLSVFLENSFKNVFPRQLSASHTHLYTKDSLNESFILF